MSGKKKPFSLVELLIVIAILAVLMSLLQPSLNATIFKARLVQCSTNLKSIFLGLMNYAEDYDTSYPKDGPIRLDWLDYSQPNHMDLRDKIFPYWGGNINAKFPDLLNCPAGVNEFPERKGEPYYSTYFNIPTKHYKDETVPDPDCAICSQGTPSHTRNVDYMRRIGDTWSGGAYNKSPRLWNVLASDYTDHANDLKQDSFAWRIGIASNHINGGDRIMRKLNIHLPTKYQLTLFGEVTSNFILDDGSVHKFSFLRISSDQYTEDIVRILLMTSRKWYERRLCLIPAELSAK